MQQVIQERKCEFINETRARWKLSLNVNASLFKEHFSHYAVLPGPLLFQR